MAIRTTTKPNRRVHGDVTKLRATETFLRGEKTRGTIWLVHVSPSDCMGTATEKEMSRLLMTSASAPRRNEIRNNFTTTWSNVDSPRGVPRFALVLDETNKNVEATHDVITWARRTIFVMNM